VETMRRQGMWDNCLFALTADHGEEFLEHGGTSHFPRKVTQELIHVPLLLHSPEMKPATHIRAPFSLLHLAPTLLRALDLPIPSSFRGQEQWTTLERENSWYPTVTESTSSNPCVADDLGQRSLAVREAQYKLVFDLDSRQEQLFDLNSDPAELHPLSLDSERPVRRRLLERARQHLIDSWRLCDSRLRADLALRNLRHRMSV